MRNQFLCKNNIANNIIAVKITAYAVHSSIEMNKQFRQGHEDLADPDDLEVEIEELEPTIPSAMEWYTYFQANRFKLDDNVVKFVKDAKESIKDTRKGSMGEYVKTHF